MISPTTSLLILTIVWMVVIFLSINKFHTPLNPLTFYLAFDAGLRVILSCSMIFYLNLPGFDSRSISKTLNLQLLYIIAYSVPFWFNFNFSNNRTLDKILKRTAQIKRFNLGISFSAALLVVNILLVATIGQGRLKWITDNRDAYQNYRFGVGSFYLLFVWSISLLLALLLFKYRSNIKKLCIYASIILVIAYLSGSKQVVLVNILLCLFFWDSTISRFTVKAYAALGFSLFSIFLLLQVSQGTAKSLTDTLAYFDYFQNTVKYISISNQIGPLHGHGFISSLWGYAPRTIFPHKPYIYGQLLIQDAVFPGVAEISSFYPAFSDWALYYLDWGWIGILVFGFFLGLFSAFFYRLYLSNKSNFIAFQLAAQFIFTLYMVPLHGTLYLVAWFILMYLFLFPPKRPIMNNL
jgi:oligosaccharide repeat unit polymerase